MELKRAAGVLLPVFSLPTRYGIGGFSKEAYEFVDRLAEAGQTYWQILPIGPTGYGDSPYQSDSTFAGNPYFVSLDELKEEGLLTEEECSEADCGQNPGCVDYEKVYNTRLPVLRKAYERFIVSGENQQKLDRFFEEQKEWLIDYLDFVCIKQELGGIAWTEWPDELRKRDPEAIRKMREKLSDEIRFRGFIQYEFSIQWSRLKQYANSRGILIIGDIPIYVSMDGADVWAEPELFQFDENLLPRGVAGVPPDAFAKTGQLWGNPLYDWEAQKRGGYGWWIRRIQHCLDWYDVIRLDHFRGFEAYYSVPYGDKTAENGHWEKGPGMDLLNVLKNWFPGIRLIAEDLGFLTDDVHKMVADSGFPGMKVLHFAFDSGCSNIYLPHHYSRNCIVYTGTHDNETTRGWYGNLNEKTRKFLCGYLNLPFVEKEEEKETSGTAEAGARSDNVAEEIRKDTRPEKTEDPAEEKIADALIHLAMESVGDTCIIQMQDYLNLGNEARINFPSSLGGNNWKWRMLPGQFTEETAQRMLELTRLYGRQGDREDEGEE